MRENKQIILQHNIRSINSILASQVISSTTLSKLTQLLNPQSNIMQGFAQHGLNIDVNDPAWVMLKDKIKLLMYCFKLIKFRTALPPSKERVGSGNWDKLSKELTLFILGYLSWQDKALAAAPVSKSWYKFVEFSPVFDLLIPFNQITVAFRQRDLQCYTMIVVPNIFPSPIIPTIHELRSTIKTIKYNPHFLESTFRIERGRFSCFNSHYLKSIRAREYAVKAARIQRWLLKIYVLSALIEAVLGDYLAPTANSSQWILGMILILDVFRKEIRTLAYPRIAVSAQASNIRQSLNKLSGNPRAQTIFTQDDAKHLQRSWKLEQSMTELNVDSSTKEEKRQSSGLLP